MGHQLEFLESVLGKSFVKLGKTIKSITKPFDKATEAVQNVSGALKEMEKMVNEVIRGNWGNGIRRYEKLTEAGYNYYAIQNKVNETLGSSFRYSDELVGAQKELNKAQEEGITNCIDSCTLMKQYGYTLHTVIGTPENIKITKNNCKN